MKYKKRISRIAAFLCGCCVLLFSMATPAKADSGVPAPVFTIPMPGQTVLQGGDHPDSFFFTYDAQGYLVSHLEVEYNLDQQGDWQSYEYFSHIDPSTGVNGIFEVFDNYIATMQPHSTVQIRARAVYETSEVSNWAYSGLHKRNAWPYTPTMTISPNPASCHRRYEDVINLSWSAATDDDGNAVGYQIELGLWNGRYYTYLTIGRTESLSFSYDISRSTVIESVNIPAIARGQKFAVRLQAYDYLDASTVTSTIYDLYRNIVPSSVTNVQVVESEVAVGTPVTISFTPGADPDGDVVGYEAALKDADGIWFNGGAVVGTATTASPTAITITPGEWSVVGSQWTCFVRAVDSSGVRSGWSEFGATFIVCTESSGSGFVDHVVLDTDQGVVGIYGSIQPAMVSAEVTINACFVINPNAANPDSRFISPQIHIRNTSEMPVEILLLSCKATGSAPKLIDPGLFNLDQWAKLGAADSMKYIALGYQGSKCGSIWFENEVAQQPKSLGVFQSGEASAASIQARYGLAWKQQENFKYLMTFEIKLVP